MRNSNAIRGAGVALVTPFRNGEVDFAALTNIIEKQIASGVDFLVSLGTTGEPVTLSGDECRAVFAHTLKVVAGRVPVVAGLFGGNNTASLILRFKEYDLTGFAAIMSSSPYYTKPSQEGIYQHYMKIAEASPLPIIIYNVPGRTASNVLPETILRLAKASEKFIAVKEASGDVVQAAKILKGRPDDFLVLSGDDPTSVALMSLGADGCISVIGNALPELYADMIHAAQNANFVEASRLHLATLDVHHWLYVENNPCGVKAAMEITGMCTREVRLPLVPFTERNYLKLKKELERVEENCKAVKL